MTRRARRLEERPPCVDVADDDVDLALASAAADGKAVKERSDVRDLRRHEHEGRHAFVSTSAEDDRADALAFVVEEHDVGAHQVGTAVVTAARVRSMTERAVDREKGFAPFNRRWVADGTLRVGDEPTLPTGWRAARAPRRVLTRCTLSDLARGLRRNDAEPQRDATEHTSARATSVHERSNSSTV